MKNLSEIAVIRKTGNEPFTIKGVPLPMNMLSFWQWSASNIVGNAMRGILAEYIVTSAVGASNETRTEWDVCDIVTAEGIKVEVKSCAYIQSWEQKKYSAIQFNIRPTQGWDENLNKRTKEVFRQADVYVFCLLKHKDQDTINPLDLEQWVFYVLSTEVLNRSVGGLKTISLSTLIRLSPLEAQYDELYPAIKRAANRTNQKTVP